MQRCKEADRNDPPGSKELVTDCWAQEGLAILEENMVMANLVHRDFENEIAKFGDVVNTRRPGEFKIRRKTDGTPLVQQNASATNVPVTLDQWFYQSFVIRDGEGSKSFQELTDIYLRPAMLSISRGIDRALLGRVHAYLGAPAGGRVGKLGGLSKDTARDYCLDAREILNVNKAPVDGRRLILAPGSETAMLKTELFIRADQRGDGGTALENAILGRILVFDTYMEDSNNPAEAVIKLSGTPPATNQRWFYNPTGAFGLSFDFDKTGGGTLSMRAVADKCRNEAPGAAGKRMMAGNRVNYAEDRDWSF